MEQRVPGEALAKAKEEYPPQEYVIISYPEEVQDEDEGGVCQEG